MTVPSDAARTADAGRLWTGGIATAAMYLAVGLSIGSLLSGVARSAVRRRA